MGDYSVPAFTLKPSKLNIYHTSLEQILMNVSCEHPYKCETAIGQCYYITMWCPTTSYIATPCGTCQACFGEYVSSFYGSKAVNSARRFVGTIEIEAAA